MIYQFFEGKLEGKTVNGGIFIVSYYLYKHVNRKIHAEILDPQTGARIATRILGL
jgi:hypothetical protein